MNRFLLIAAIIVSFLLLSPYVGIDLFSSGGSAPETIPKSSIITTHRAEQKKESAKAVRGRTTMVEDILSSSPENQAKEQPQQSLSDIEEMLNKNGQNK